MSESNPTDIEEYVERIKTAITEAEKAGAWADADRGFTELLRHVRVTGDLVGRHAIAVFKAGDPARAATMTRRAIRLDPDNPGLHLQLGKIYFDRGQNEKAEESLRTVIEKVPDNIEARLKLAQMLQQTRAGRPEAIEHLRRVVELAPDHLHGLLQLGAALGNDKETFKEAEEVLQRALEIAPEAPSALHNYGLLKRFQGDLETAEKYLKKSFDVYPNDANYAFSLGTCYLFMEDIEQALHWFKKAAELDPSHNPAQVYIAFSLFHLGRMREGWVQYEKRLGLKELQAANYQRPRWDGQPMPDRTLLLLGEQGIGDNLQFIRYAPLAAKMVGAVIVLAAKPLERLYRSIEGVVVMPGLPEAKHFHRYCPLMSMPYTMGTDETSVPGDVPYLRAPGDLIAAWREKLKDYPGKKVGLCWRGNSRHVNDHFRSSSLSEMAQLLDIPGISFFSLHKERPDFEADLPEGLIDIGSDFEDFADTAAAMESLDLVISVDTSVCHVAGAVARPVWTMLARGPDFRWGLHGEETPWYPTMRLFRQQTLGDWRDVYERMRAGLVELSAS